MKNSFFVLPLVTAVLFFSACSPQKEERHVIFIGLDGWGAYCMEKADMPVTRQFNDFQGNQGSTP